MFHINETVFNSIIRRTGTGSIMQMTVHDSQKFSLYSSNFTNCMCNDGSGGALSLTLRQKGQLSLGTLGTIVNEPLSVFTNCSAKASSNTSLTHLTENGDSKSCGGAIYLSIETELEEDSLVLKNLKFSNCQAQTGKSLFVYTEDCTVSNNDLLWSDIREENALSKNDFVMHDKNGKQKDMSSSETHSLKRNILIICIACSAVFVSVTVIILVVVFCTRKHKKSNKKDVPLLEQNDLYSSFNALSTDSSLQINSSHTSINPSEILLSDASSDLSISSIHSQESTNEFPDNSSSMIPTFNVSAIDPSSFDKAFDQQKLYFE